ncbi:MAG: rhodanese-like domain-containing protein [Acidimicrobiales bacterium]
MPEFITPQTLTEWLLDGAELAVLDAREQGVYFDSHLFHAACVPLSQVELLLDTLVPRRDTRVVWCDDGSGDATSGLAARAANRAQELGWTGGVVLQGGTAAWAAAGGELYSGVNVPSKAFGEYVEHSFDTPRIPASELKALIDGKENMVILDSRPIEEFRNMSIPTGTDCPGAELVHRVKEMAPDPETLVVVNCAGRTRSIIGAQSLINAGLENRVVALENGTMGWELAGFNVERGRDIHAPDPSPESQAWSVEAAAAVAKRFGVAEVSTDQVAQWTADPERTTYVLDVRTPGEFAEGHLAGSRNAPGGQLVQATDEYIATRNCRIVLVDDNGVRATMTASWLRQLGWNETVVLAGGLLDLPLTSDLPARQSFGPVPTIKVSALAERLAASADDPDGSLAVLDLGTSLKYRKRGHIPGSWWGVRSRLEQARAAIGEVSTLVLTSTDGQLAKLAVADAAPLWPDAEVLALAGGNKGWRHADHDMEPGFTKPTTEANDVWYKPYDHDDGDEVAEQHMQDYLTWEIALVEQLDRDPTVSFPTF